MRIACLGGGPSGLYFAISMKLRQPDAEVVVLERNKPDDTFGWGVVLSEETLQNLKENDPISAVKISENFAYWDDIICHYRGEKMFSTGHGFCGIGRMSLLKVLQERARELGVEMRFETEFESAQTFMDEFDVVVASDGLNSRARSEFADVFKPDIDTRACQFVWLGTKQKFNDAFTFIFEETDKGWMWAHAYQFDDDTATFIVETDQATWDAYGFGEMSQKDSIAICEEVFKDHLGGHDLMTNANHVRGSAWIRFPRVLCEKWSHKNLALMGDAAASAHFSIGSGTKLALESAIALADYISEEPTLEAAFDKYEDARRLEVLRLQSAARNSLEWFEDIHRYLHLDPVQFNYSMLTRSQRISHENLRLRDPKWMESAERWFQTKAGVPADAPVRPPMFTPYKLREMELKNRVVMSPMAQYKCDGDGTLNDWHLIHYAERAKGGAALIFTEMTCVSAQGRITPGCPGLYAPEHEAAWQRLAGFIHKETTAKICCQIGHSGRKGSTRLAWDGMDKPLNDGNWEIISASAMKYKPDSDTPRAMTRADMDVVRDQFVASVQMADRAGFDMIEMHAAHGYLLGAFLSPAANIRDDEYGGSLENRLRFPVEVFNAMRAAWPKDKPMSVRISAHDWVGEDGNQPEDAVELAKAFYAAGADIIDVSSGQTTSEEKPVYGRMFQVPFSDRIRNDAGIKTMCVGNIYEADHVNSILMAGRADLVCIARAHLADPYWTLHQGAVIGDRHADWPKPYQAGRDQLWRNADREAELNQQVRV